MPPRNLYAILIVAIASTLCHLRAEKTRNGALVGDAISLIDMFYVEEVDKRELLEAAMAGLTSKLDPYTQFIPPTAYDSFQDSLQQEFAGIGILIDQPTAGQPVRVITPLVGSPALQAGFRPGDRILAISGKSTEGMKIDDVRELLRGPIGTNVKVRIQRGDPPRLQMPPSDQESATGEDSPASENPNAEPAATAETAADEPQLETGESTAVDNPSQANPAPESATPGEIVELVVERANIQVESVTGDHRDVNNEWVYSMNDNPNVAYVRVTSFGERTTTELRQVFKKLDNKFEGVIVDLRGNAGGLLLSAVDVCDMFLDEGRIVSTRGRGVLDPNQTNLDAITDSKYDATPGTLVDPSKPMVVLVDGDSASASEIVAACLKDHGRAVIVGERSFGKGSVQNVFALESGRSALKLTTSRYYRPNGANIHRGTDATEDDDWGVRPSDGYEVPLDAATRRRANLRWELATYPSMAEAVREDSPAEGPLEEVDPQLWKALQAVEEVSPATTPDTAETQPAAA